MVWSFQIFKNLKHLRKSIWAVCLRKLLISWVACFRWILLIDSLVNKLFNILGLTTLEIQMMMRIYSTWLPLCKDQYTQASQGLQAMAKSSILTKIHSKISFNNKTLKNIMVQWATQRKKLRLFKNHRPKVLHLVVSKCTWLMEQVSTWLTKNISIAKSHKTIVKIKLMEVQTLLVAIKSIRGMTVITEAQVLMLKIRKMH